MNKPRAVIAGTGHHGSGYIARVLREAGILCGHEQYYSLHQEPEELIVDSSWLAVPKLKDYEGIIWHQVRDPLKVVTSFADTKNHYAGNTYGEVRRSATRPFTGNPLVDAMATVIDLNEKVEQFATKRWKVEEVGSDLIIELGQVLGAQVDKETAESAISAVSRKTNQHTRATTLTWDELPDVGVKEELQDMARRYGYE